MQSTQSKRQFWAMTSVLLLTLTVVPRIIAMAGGTTVEAKPPISPMQSVYLEFARIAELLESGKTAQAKRLLERLGGESLIIQSAAGGEGALMKFSPTSLLLHVGRAMIQTAVKEADKGNRTEALSWLARCRELSSQVLATDTPNLDALNLGRSLDVLSGRSEVDVRKRLGDTEGAQLAAAREDRAWKFYLENMRPRIDALPDRASITTGEVKALMAVYQSQRLRFTAMGSQSDSAADS